MAGYIVDQFAFLPISKQRRWQLRRMNKLRCAICGGKLGPDDQHYCEHHREQINRLMRERGARMRAEKSAKAVTP